MVRIALLPDRAALEMSGADRVKFLNGLVSNDVSLAAPGCAVWAALLTPQGKYLADFFILAAADRLWLDCDASQAEAVASRLARFRLRADVAIAATDLRVYAAWGGEPPEGLLSDTSAAPDPRLPQAGWRILSPRDLPENATASEYEAHRIALGLPGARDLEPEKSVLLEAGFDELHGISWTKGCYMGQELTARTRYRGLVKRRLLPVSASAGLPPSGTAVFSGQREVGQLRSHNGHSGIASLRLDAVADTALVCGDVPLAVHVPGWARLPERAGG